MVADVAQSRGDSFIFDSNTPGGFTLNGHSTNATSQAKIAQGLKGEGLEGIMAYGLGRTVEFSDQDAIKALLDHVRKNNYKSRELIHALVQHKLFQHK